MSHSLATPPPSAAPRSWLARLWAEPDTRSILIGILAVVVIHMLLWLVGPRFLRMEARALPPRTADDQGKFYNIELNPETPVKEQEKPKDPFKFVETNPDAPENTPDKTTNFAAQNQQAAEQTPDPTSKADRASTTGKKDFESNQIVSGRLTSPLENLAAIPPSPETAQSEQEKMVQKQRAEQNPLTGFDKKEGDAKDGIGTNIAPHLANAQAVPERVEGGKDVLHDDSATGLTAAIDPRRPRPRPQLVKTQNTRPAILSENPVKAPNMGLSGIDAKWSEYGQYLQKMIDAVQFQWERLILNLSAMPAGGTNVSVKFVLNSEGNIATVVSVNGTANETATRACVSAITERAPYGAWTDDMRAALGDKQEMTFTFYYQ